MGARKAEMLNMSAGPGGRTRLEFSISSQALMGFRLLMMTQTRGEGIINAVFDGYAPITDLPVERRNSALVATETGESVGYGLFNAQERGVLLIGPGVPVYAGMVVGANPRKGEDIVVNVCKAQARAPTRAPSGSATKRCASRRRGTLSPGAGDGVDLRRRAGRE